MLAISSQAGSLLERVAANPESDEAAPECRVATRVVRHTTLHGEATVGTNREGHGNLAGRRVVGGWRKKMQER